ncbi:helix-turn-helix domain-containing protein [Ktedonobacter robiniae]|uniref:HTH cro/C1-type domain-containing protein n=1 Tax=Ktedonobacter robiniae TaxID=2778365 RepID=A0ABQ3UWB5_9CHLR|nr:helix-turn-helix transcriptional regulator [Ktedonobacter robiniae]GHO56979.1 hypothetical protein KSB_54540 [Ktedonobacter robiniae]
MPISCQLRVLLARLNVERAMQNTSPISLRRMAEESGVSLSVLVALHTGRSQRVDYTTLDRLLTYFNRFFPVTINDLLTWESASEEETHIAVG